MEQKDIDRFWSKVDQTGDCWVWTSQTRAGYGLFRLGPKVVSAHRLSFEMASGGINKKLQVRHTCDNPPCVRPSHLVQGTAKSNSQDMYDRDRHAWLPRAVVEDIRSRPMTNTIVADLAVEFRQSESVIRKVLDGSSYSMWPGARPVVKQYVRNKLTQEQVQEIREALKKPYRGIGNDLAQKYNVNRSMISHIKHGRFREHDGY